MVSTLRRPSAVASPGAVAWMRARPWVYPCVVLALWAVIPGLRRVVDWKSSFSAVSVVSIVPLVALLPAAVALALGGRGARLRPSMLVALWIWIGAFAYAYVVGVTTGNAAAATYTLAGFLLPALFGAYVATLDVAGAELYEKIAAFALALSVPVSLYAFVQYVAPPGWDLYWIQQTNLVSVGSARAFEFRPFSTLNGPGAFADFTMAVLVLNLPRLRSRSLLRGCAIVLDLAALGITLVRADWIALAFATIVFVALSPRRLQNLSAIAVAAIAFTLLAFNAASLSGDAQSGAAITDRFATLGSVTTDSSFRDRERLFGDALSSAIATPIGAGLGVVGTAAKLGASAATVDFDNGYIARFTEMGYVGFAGYLVALVAMLAMAFSRWTTARRGGDLRAASVVAAAIAMQAAFAFLDISGDHHAQLPGLFFWLSFALIFSYRSIGPAS